MLIRLALVGLVIAVWAVMPQTAQEAQPQRRHEVALPKESALVPTQTSPQVSVPKDGSKASMKKKEKRRKKKKKKRKKNRRKGKGKLEKRKRRRQNKRRRRKKLKRKGKKSNKNGHRQRRKKKKKKGRKQKDRKKRRNGKRRRGMPSKMRRDRKIRGRKRRAKTRCETDDDCKPNHCCQVIRKVKVCSRPGRGLRCFGPCMCRLRKKTRNFFCVTKKNKMLKHYAEFGRNTTRLIRGHCRNITLAELESPTQKFTEIKPLKRQPSN